MGIVGSQGHECRMESGLLVTGKKFSCFLTFQGPYTNDVTKIWSTRQKQCVSQCQVPMRKKLIFSP
jgi:hypothetical protein